MKVVVTVKELREAFKTVRRLGEPFGSVRFVAGDELLIEGERFAAKLICETVEAGEAAIPDRAFASILRVLSTFRDDSLELAIDDEHVCLGSFTFPITTAGEVEERPSASGASAPLPGVLGHRAVLAETIRDNWNVWANPERLDAVRALGQAALEADKGLSKFGVEPDDVLAIVARRIGTSNVVRLRSLIEAVTRHHPWPRQE